MLVSCVIMIILILVSNLWEIDIIVLASLGRDSLGEV